MPLICKVFDPSRRHGYEDMGETCDTLQAAMGTGGGNVPIVVKAFDITGETSNSMKSPNPTSCFKEREVARTLDGFCGDPLCNQGG